MSQFSISFHLRSDNPNEVVDLLTKCKLNGYVFPQENGWVTFVCEEEDIEKNYKLINANQGLLIYYNYAEDFGWGFSVYQANNKVCSYDCLWCGPVFDEDGEVVFNEDGELSEIEDLNIDDRNLNMDVLLKLLGNDSSKMDEMKKILYPESIATAIEDIPSYSFAELLGIKNIDWVSYRYVSGNLDEGIIRVLK